MLYVLNFGRAASIVTAYASGSSRNAPPVVRVLAPIPLPVAIAAHDSTVAVLAENAIVFPSASSKGVRTIAGKRTLLASPVGIALSSQGEIFVANFSYHHVLVFAPSANGDAAPARVLSGYRVGLRAAAAIAAGRDGRCYVAGGIEGHFGSGVAVYAPGAKGNIAPERVIAGPKTMLSGLATALAVDPSGNVYVLTQHFAADSVNGRPDVAIAVFEPRSHGNVAPIRRIEGRRTGLGAGAVALAVNESAIYVADRDASRILIFARSARGNVSPRSSLHGRNTLLERPLSLALGAL